MRLLIVVALLMSSTSAHSQTAKLSGAFVHVGYGATDEVITVSQLPSFLDEVKDLGNDTIILSQIRAAKAGQGCPINVNDFEWVKGFPSKLGKILDAARARGMKVMVGTTLASRDCWNFWLNTSTVDAVDADTQQAISAVAAAYGSHPAFMGWYIPDEPGPVPPASYNYYRRVTAKLKSLLPGKPVAVAPYLGDPVSAASLASAASSFRNATGVDIQIWQDGIGANPNARLFNWSGSYPTTENYYQALSAVLGSGLWADIELFNHGTPLFLKTESGLSGAYRPASAQRVNQQLWSARFAAKKVSWLHQWQMSEVIGPSHGYQEAPRLMGIYKAFYNLGNSIIFPINHSSYTWLSSVSPSYPDISGSKLFDRQTGNPRNPMDPAWIGISGTAKVRIDIGSSKRIDWIGIHTMTNPSWGIRTPVSVDIYCGESATSLSKISTASAPFTQNGIGSSSEEEYVLGNRSPLNATCRFMELRMPNSYWTFISEIEASSE